jgi:hypothetical protein
MLVWLTDNVFAGKCAHLRERNAQFSRRFDDGF